MKEKGEGYNVFFPKVYIIRKNSSRLMEEEKLAELRERLFNLERRIAPLEWDASRNQINEFKKLQLDKLKEEKQVLKQEFEGLLKTD